MALAKQNLGFPINVSFGTTVSICEVTSSQKIYIRSLLVYNSSVESASPNTPQTFQVYIVPNDSGSVGIASSTDRILRASIISDDTYFMELQYPIILENNGDSLQVFNEGDYAWIQSGIATSYSALNVLVLGDKEV